MKEALSTPSFWLLGVTFGLGFMAATAITAHQVAILQDAGLTLEVASTIAGVTLGMSMGGRFAVGWASERLQHLHQIVSLCLLMQAVGVGLLLLLSALGLWVLASSGQSCPCGGGSVARVGRNAIASGERPIPTSPRQYPLFGFDHPHGHWSCPRNPFPKRVKCG